MSTLIQRPQLVAASGIVTPNDDKVRQQVWRLLARLYPLNQNAERRADQRFPYPHLLYLTPILPNGAPLVGESRVVVGKTLSERGLGFFHREPLEHRRMLVSLEVADEKFIGFVIDITWCRFNRYGWYESGGRLLEVMESPLNDEEPQTG